MNNTPPSTHHNETIVILDTETTGLDHKSEKVIEIAAVKMYNGEIIDRFHSLVNPEKEIRHASFMIHHISDEEVANAPTIDKVLPDFLAFMGDHTFVAHNALFDYSFINEPMKALYEKRFENPRIDSLELYRSVFPDEPSHSLNALLKRFGYEETVLHRAMDDALCLAKVYYPLKTLYDQKHAWQLSQLPNVAYLLERYFRLQKAANAIQSEMSDLKDVFKLYFLEKGEPVTATTKETMVSNYKRTYSYNDAAVWEIMLKHELHKRVFKLNPRMLDRLIDRDKDLPDGVREALVDTRVSMHEARGIVFIKPQANETEGASQAQSQQNENKHQEEKTTESKHAE
ncbi:MAG: 3'-5' exonuclease [Cyanobacteria bacterium P01_H01_bin.74]